MDTPNRLLAPGGRGSTLLHFLLYNALLALSLPLLLLYLLRQQLFSRRRWRHGGWQRLGLLPRAPRGRRVLWAHAVSAGEAVALAPILREVRRLTPEAWLLVTTLTDTGQRMARERCGELADAIAYLPVDLLPCVALAMRRVRPHVLMLTETELWPNLLHLCRCRGTRVLVVNGRISDRNLRRMRWPITWLFRGVLQLVDRFCAQSEHYRGRAVALGMPAQRTCVMGNAKIDSALSAAPPEKMAELRRALGLAEGEALLVAGSTHPGEELPVLEAFGQVLKQFPACRLVLAPRHVHRADEVEEQVLAAGLSCVRRSALAGAAGQAQVILLDTMGELGAAYALCQAAFVGGSLIATIGGHNVLEPVACGKLVCYGPHMFGQPELERAVREAGLGRQVEGATELAQAWCEVLASPQRQAEIAARAAVFAQAQRGVAAGYGELVAQELGR